MTARAVSVVVPTRNRAPMLRALLDALGRQTLPDLEVIIVDDASTDETPAVLQAWEGPGHVALRLEEPSGSYAARNRGWRAAGGEVIAFTDDDCLPDPRWAEGLVRAIERDEHAVGAQGMTVAGPGEITPFTHQIDQRHPGPPYRTCNIAYRRSVLEALGGFEDSLRWYADNILGLRARELGPIAWAPEAVVHHPPRPREWRDREQWLARFAADAVHRDWLHRLGVEPAIVPSGMLPMVLWVLRPIVKQSAAHLLWALRHPRRYAREIRPMLGEKRALLAALRARRTAESGESREPLPALPDTPLVSVVIVTRDRPQLLDGALRAIGDGTWHRLETIVVDNGTDPRTREVASQWKAHVTEAAGLSLAAARQRGVEAAAGDIIAFTDDDCLPGRVWIEALVHALRANASLYGVQGRTVPERGDIRAHAVRVERLSGLYETCNMAYRREAVERAGGFDLRFDGWFEDTALAARVLEHGPIGFAPDAIVVHRAMPRAPRDRETWRRILCDERTLARAYPALYRRTRGPGFLPAVIARWLLGSPLKTLLAALPRARKDPAGFLCLAWLLLRERVPLIAALGDVLTERSSGGR